MSSIAISLDDPSESAGLDAVKEILKEKNYYRVEYFQLIKHLRNILLLEVQQLHLAILFVDYLS